MDKEADAHPSRHNSGARTASFVFFVPFTQIHTLLPSTNRNHPVALAQISWARTQHTHTGKDKLRGSPEMLRLSNLLLKQKQSKVPNKTLKKNLGHTKARTKSFWLNWRVLRPCARSPKVTPLAY